MSVSKKIVRVCLCYAHEDEHLLPKLLEHLKALQKQGLIIYWYERDIQAGEERDEEIFYQMNTADIILSLLSPAYIADYYSQEMKAAVISHHSRRAVLVPIILRPVYYAETPFAYISPLPKNHEPVICWANQDKAFFEIAEGIREIVEHIRGSASSLFETYFPCNSCEYLLPGGSAYCNVCGAFVQQQEEHSVFSSKAAIKRSPVKRRGLQLHDKTKILRVPVSIRRPASWRSSHQSQNSFLMCLFPSFSWFMSHVLQSMLYLLVGGIVLEIIVAFFVSSHFSATTYIPFDDAVPASIKVGAGTMIPSEKFVWPSAAISLILITNIIVTLLFLVATIFIHIHCYRTHRMQNRVRASMIFHAVLALVFGFIISPMAILDAAVPSSYFILGDLPMCGVILHIIFELPIFVVMFFCLGNFFPYIGLLKAVRAKRSMRITKPVGTQS